MKPIKTVRNSVRSGMRLIAQGINSASGGRISPNAVTLFGFLMHIPIAILIAKNNLVLAAVLLIVFGLLDAVDGELARLQQRSSSAGMLLDASTDRFKEVILYTAAAYSIVTYGEASSAYIAVLACGSALCVSYVKAKGESAIATSGKHINHARLNKLFADGLASFDIRILLFAVGLATDTLVPALAIIAVLATSTAFFRLYKIMKSLQ